MRIFQVINVRWYNATAWYALYLSRLLQDAGHEVLVLVQPGTAPETKAREMGLRTAALDLNTVNPLRLGGTIARMVGLLRDLRPDVVNCHRGEGFVLWGLLRPLAGYKLIRTRGDQRLPRSNAVNRWLHACVADAVVVTNRRMAEHFLHDMRTPERSVWLVHGGVDTGRFHFDPEGRERVRAEFGYEPEHRVVGLLGRFDQVKGQRETIHAVSRLYHERGRREVRLMLAGFESAMDRARVERWIEEHDAARFTIITGRRDDVAACISAMDVGVVASLWSEAIARAALEIMACDRPLLSSDVNVMPDLVPPRAMFPAGDVGAMTDRIERALTDGPYLESLMEEERRTMSQLTPREFVTRTLSLYQRLLDRD